jgi:hypothetical protein
MNSFFCFESSSTVPTQVINLELMPAQSKISATKPPSSHPTSIGRVLSTMLPPLKVKDSVDPSIVSLTKRVSNLEHRLQKLDLLVKQLRMIVRQK